MTPLGRLMAWYKSNCNGDWEHSYGVSVSTLDNPGWSLRISLADTVLEGEPFDSIEENRSDGDWIVCRLEDSEGKSFAAYGGPGNLEEMLLTFLCWAESVPIQSNEKG